jgi:mono/diheme cytochrome c family protein
MARYEVGHQAQAIEVGAVLFENNCRGCHGNQGEGILGLCPPLNDRNFFTNRLKEVGWSGTLEDYIVSTVAGGRLTSTRPDQFVGNGRPAMPAWSETYGGPLREDQIRDLAKFILNWESSAMGQYEPAEVVSPVSDDPVVRGQTVYGTYGCGGCHTIEGLSSGVTGPNQTHIGSEAATRVGGTAQSNIYGNRSSIRTPMSWRDLTLISCLKIMGISSARKS